MDIPDVQLGPPLPPEDPHPPRKLSLLGEHLRWGLAAAAMLVLLLEVLLGKAGWALYAAIVVGAAGYFTGDVVANRFGGYALSRNQQATRRRLSMIPALWIFYRGTSFRIGSPLHLFLQSAALLLALVLLLGPEPRE